MLELKKTPKRAKTRARLEEADSYFAQKWLMGTTFISKTEANLQFGRVAANQALSRYFVLTRRGSNVTKKLTEIQPREIDDLPEERQSYLLQLATEKNVNLDIKISIPEPPTEYDCKSVICVIKENGDKAVQWCIDNKKFHLIRPVRILMQHRMWEVFYVEKSNRFYATWPFCLTNWPSELRKMILNGVDFDLTNAIGQFILEKAGTNIIKYPAAKHYLEEPSSIRQQLMKKLRIDEKQAKKVLHATLNGANIAANSIKLGKSALLTIIDEVTAIKYVNTFGPLINQLKVLRKNIAPNNKQFMRSYFEWEQQKTGTFFSGTGLIMHDGIDGCSLSTVIPAQFSSDIKISATRGVWDEESVVDRLVQM